MRLQLEEKDTKSWRKSRFYTAVMWMLTVFMFLSALVFIPSAASVVMLLFVLVAIPIERVQQFLASKKLTGSVQMVVLLVLFVLAVILAPT